MSSIARLADREFNGHLRRRIPHALDDVVEGVVADYRSAPPTQRRDMLGEVQPRIADVLSAYGERMAAVAVRQRSTEPLRRGLVAMGMAEGALTDPRNNLFVLAAVNHSAAAVGSDLSTLINEVAADLPERAIAAFRQFAQRSDRDKSLAAMGMKTRGEGDQFRYVG